MGDPTATGAFDGPMPLVRHAVQPHRLVQYTNVNQFDFFVQWINWCEGQSQQRNGANVRLDEEDGTTIRWYGFYYLPLGGYLVEGRTAITEQQLRGQMFPVAQWPDDLRPIFDPAWLDPDEYTLPGEQTYPSERVYPRDEEYG